MKLVVPVPAGWQQHAVPDGTLLQAPGDAFGILVLPLVAAPPDPDAWMQHALVHRTHQRGVEPSALQWSRFATDDGWAAILLDGAIGSEARLVAFFGFFDYAATAIAICRDPAAHPAWRDEVIRALAQARPDFAQGGVVCLSELLGRPSPTVARPPLPARGGGWRRTFVGGDLVFSGEDGPGAAWIRITQRVAPIRSVDQIFGGFLAQASSATVVPPTLTATAEGAYAAVAHATYPARQHTLAVVFGEEHYAQIEAVVADPAQYGRYRDVVTELVYTTTLGLGATRWRPFYYQPPAGWSGIARQRGALWISPSCPRRYQVMRVFDARPPADHRARGGARMFETLPPEFFVEPAKGPVEFYTADDLPCRVSVFTGKVPNRPGEITALEGTLVQERYIYPIRLECDAELLEESMHVFERVVASIRTIPEPGAEITPDLGAFHNWAD